MSGGHFDYKEYSIQLISEEIQHIIETNDDTTLDKYGNPRGYLFNPTTLEALKEVVKTLNRAAIMAKRVDYLLSGDDGEDTFIERLNKDLSKLKD